VIGPKATNFKQASMAILELDFNLCEGGQNEVEVSMRR